MKFWVPPFDWNEWAKHLCSHPARWTMVTTDDEEKGQMTIKHGSLLKHWAIVTAACSECKWNRRLLPISWHHRQLQLFLHVFVQEKCLLLMEWWVVASVLIKVLSKNPAKTHQSFFKTHERLLMGTLVHLTVQVAHQKGRHCRCHNNLQKNSLFSFGIFTQFPGISAHF